MKATCEADIGAALKAEGFDLDEGRPLRIIDEWKYCQLCKRLRRPMLKVPCGKKWWTSICPDRIACVAAQRGGNSEPLRTLLGEVNIPEIVAAQSNEEPHE